MFFRLFSNVSLLSYALLYLIQAVFTNALNITLIPIGKKLQILTTPGRSTESTADTTGLSTVTPSLDDLQHAVDKLLGKTNFGVLSGIPIPTMYPLQSPASSTGFDTTTTPFIQMDVDRGNFVNVDSKPSVLTDKSRLHFPSENMQLMASNNVFNPYDVPLSPLFGGHSPAQFSAGQPNYNPAQFFPSLEGSPSTLSKLQTIIKPGLMSILNITFATSGQPKGVDPNPISASVAIPKFVNSLESSSGTLSDSHGLSAQRFGMLSTGNARIPTIESNGGDQKSESMILKNLLANRPVSIIYDGATAVKPNIAGPNCNKMH